MGAAPVIVIVVCLAAAWALGGLALRLGGTLAFWAGLIGLLATGEAFGLLVAVLGSVAWIAGQTHHVLRHGGARGPLGGTILGLLRRQDGT